MSETFCTSAATSVSTSFKSVLRFTICPRGVDIALLKLVMAAVRAARENRSPLLGKTYGGTGWRRIRNSVSAVGCFPLPAGEGLRVRENRPPILRATLFMEML